MTNKPKLAIKRDTSQSKKIRLLNQQSAGQTQVG
jgi:hypothetical protein